MTVYLYSGTPGSGKSLHAANDIRFALNRRSPRPVVANFPVNLELVKHPDYFHYLSNFELSPQWLYDFADGYWSGRDDFHEDRILLVIDECQLLFNSREWSAKDRLAWLEFFSQHRKYGYKVLFVAQASKMVDNQFRMLIEYEVNHRKMANAGLAGWLMSLPFRGLLFAQVLYYFQQGERLSCSWYVARKADMRLYETHRRFERVQRSPLPRVATDPSL